MKPEIKQQWIDALRSGRYQKTRGQLRRGNCYCVFGVLCDLHSKATGHKWNDARYFSHDLAVPDDVIKWAGMEGEDSVCLLMDFNDSDTNATFDECADVIQMMY